MIFRESAERPYAGSLSLGDGVLVLSGAGGGDVCELRVPAAEIAAIRTSRAQDERLHGYPVLVVERAAAEPLLVAPIGAGLLAEVADLLMALTAGDAAEERVAVELPLRRDSLGRARRLIERGPPFEPDALGGLRHAVHLGHDSVVFVFEGPAARRSVEQLMRRPSLWRAGLAWRECAAGRPRVVSFEPGPDDGYELVFEWGPGYDRNR